MTLISVDDFGNFAPDYWVRVWQTTHIESVDKVDLYFHCLYWAIETLSTVGYGDMLPTTTPEIIWAACVQLGGTATFGYITASLASMITRADEYADAKRGEIFKICKWMRKKELPTRLKVRIREHFEYKWRISSIYDEMEILSSIPSFLRTEIALSMYKPVLTRVSFLRELGNRCVAALVTALQPVRATESQTIIQMHQVGTEMSVPASFPVSLLLLRVQLYRH